MGSAQHPARNSHVLPRAYLKGFAATSDPGSVWVYRRGAPFEATRSPRARRSPRLQRLRSAGVSRDYYAYQTLHGETVYDRVEQGLQRQEVACDTVLRDIRGRKPVDTAMKQRLSSYIRMMLMRVPTRETWAAPGFDRALDSFPRNELARKAAEEGRFTEALKLTRDWDEHRPHFLRQLMVRSLVEPAVQGEMARIDRAIGAMTWQFFVAPYGYFFVTTDNPVVFSRPPIGLRDAKSWLAFPISSGIGLLARMLDPADRVYVDATHDEMELLNRLALTGASEFAYAREPDRHVLDAWANPLSDVELAAVSETVRSPSRRATRPAVIGVG